MARRCKITNKGVMSGNNVSHSNHKTRRKFKPNMQMVTFRSDILDANVYIKVSTRGMRTVNHNHGIDNYLLTKSDRVLDADMVRLKKLIVGTLLAQQEFTETAAA